MGRPATLGSNLDRVGDRLEFGRPLPVVSLRLVKHKGASRLTSPHFERHRFCALPVRDCVFQRTECLRDSCTPDAGIKCGEFLRFRTPDEE